MNWDVPGWLALVLLALASFRTWRAIAEDVIFDRPRAAFDRHMSEYWQDFLRCSYCMGFWCALGWWLFWVASHHWALVASVPLALSALVALIATNLTE